MNFWLFVSTNDASTRLCCKRNDFCLFLAQVRVRLIVIGGEISLKKTWFFFFVVATGLSCRPTPPKNINVRFGPRKQKSERALHFLQS